jgi:hypothetical protein
MAKHVNAFTASFSVHLLLVATLIWLSAAAVRESSRAAAAAKAAAASTPTLELARTSETPPAPAMKITAAPGNLAIPNETGSTEVVMPNFTFDFAKVRRRATSLFPFLTHDLALQPIRQLAAKSPRRSLVSPYARVVDEAPGLSPLVMSGQAMQALVDKTFSRRERWTPFQAIASLARQHHPTRGQLPVLLRRYSDQNLLQPYVESHVRDPRLWVMLGIASDHADFIDFITDYAAAHPSTPATTELLFMLDEMAQGSRDTLLTLLDIDPRRDLFWTGQRNRGAQEFVEVLQKYYRTKLEQKGIGSREGISLSYDNARLGILDAIVESTPAGYRESDARFLIGSIYWRNDLQHDAVKWWREMAPRPTDRYMASATAILAAIGDSGEVADTARVDEILQAERKRWSDFWWKRLLQFGYSISSF